MVNQEENEAANEGPGENVVDQAEQRNCELNLAVKLSNHGHLASVADHHLAQVYMAYFALLEGALLFFTLCLFLVSKSHICGCNRHQLHTEGKHHEDHQNGNYAQGLWHCVSSFDSVKLKPKEINSNFYDAVEDADESVKEYASKQYRIQE